MTDTTAPTAVLAQPVDINHRIGQFVQLRDKIKKLDEEHKAKMAPFREALDTLGGILLDHLKNQNADSVATPSGTVYRTVKNTASIADGEKFWDHVVANEDWDLLDKRANVTAVLDYIEQHQAPPPGVNFTSTMTVGVRRK